MTSFGSLSGIALEKAVVLMEMCFHMQANRGGEASTSSAAPAEEKASCDDNGVEGTAIEEDPAWLQLPAVHYALMQGNQQPCFRLATGEDDTRHWLAWEVSETLLMRIEDANIPWDMN